MSYTFYTRLHLIVPDKFKNNWMFYTYKQRIYKDKTLKEQLVLEVNGTFNSNWETSDQKVMVSNEQAAKAAVIYYDVYFMGTRIHFDIRGKRLHFPRTQSNECTSFTTKLTVDNTSNIQISKKVTQQKITPPAKTEILILYIGGAADKKAWYIPTKQGPNNNIVDTKNGIEDYLFKKNNNSILDINERYFCDYLGYYEIYTEKQREDIIKKLIKYKKVLRNMRTTYIQRTNIKDLKIIIIGHSLGGWNGAHLANYLINKGYPVNYLVTIDPVGLSGGVRLVADVISDPAPSPAVKTAWINIREIGPGFDNLVAAAGQRWIPGFEEKFVSNGSPFSGGNIVFTRSKATLPTYNFISTRSHLYTWHALLEKSRLIKVAPNDAYPRKNEKDLPTLSANEQSPWEIIRGDLDKWLAK